MNDILKRIKPPEESELLIKSFSKTIKNEAKEQKEGFLGMLWGTLSASLLKNSLRGKGTIRAGEGTVRGAQDFSCQLFLQQILKYKSIIKMNLNLMVFIEEIIYLK